MATLTVAALSLGHANPKLQQLQQSVEAIFHESQSDDGAHRGWQQTNIGVEQKTYAANQDEKRLFFWRRLPSVVFWRFRLASLMYC